MRKLLVWDLDDTLMDNTHNYSGPILDACRLIIETLKSRAPHVAQIIAMEQEIDKRRLNETNPATGKPYLYSMERFPGSLAAVYEEICKQVKVVPDAIVKELLRKIGLGAFDEGLYLRGVKPSAPEVLRFLKEQGDVSVCLTKGDKRVQAMKLAALQKAGLVFARTCIVEDNKTPDVFREIYEAAGVCSTRFSIGNIFKSDIVPALEAGYKGIYIPAETWENSGQMDEAEDAARKTGCHVFRDLKEVQDRYGELV